MLFVRDNGLLFLGLRRNDGAETQAQKKTVNARYVRALLIRINPPAIRQLPVYSYFVGTASANTLITQ
jgi:hypothetical protein